MPLLTRREAHIVWEGNLPQGSGRLRVGSGAFPELTVTWPARTEQPDGKTSPEELIAAAHATCYAMVLAALLGQRNITPERVEVSAVCSLDRVNGLKISAMDLTARIKAPGLTPADVDALVEQGNQACPVSNALRGNVEIRVKGELIA